jgi:hypothetical protein
MCLDPTQSDLMKRVHRALRDGVEITPRLRAEVERWLRPYEETGGANNSLLLSARESPGDLGDRS